jgi:hypothetical protein
MSKPSSEATEQASSWRLLLQRLLGRLRHGLLIQEVLDRLARAGLIIYPYYIVLEPLPAEPPPALSPRCTVRSLDAGDAAEMARISVRPSSEEAIVARMAQAASMGIFYDGQLAGYSWASLQRFRFHSVSGRRCSDWSQTKPTSSRSTWPPPTAACGWPGCSDTLCNTTWRDSAGGAFTA